MFREVNSCVVCPLLLGRLSKPNCQKEPSFVYWACSFHPQLNMSCFNVHPYFCLSHWLPLKNKRFEQQVDGASWLLYTCIIVLVYKINAYTSPLTFKMRQYTHIYTQLGGWVKTSPKCSSCGVHQVCSDQDLSKAVQGRNSGEPETRSWMAEDHWCTWGVKTALSGPIQQMRYWSLSCGINECWFW